MTTATTITLLLAVGIAAVLASLNVLKKMLLLKSAVVLVSTLVSSTRGNLECTPWSISVE